ncbi:MAG TPA: DUF2332 domain-containing protein [Streptomyces sp.]|nr:DUF2332 domain-containing protein [Streptomyces sp.]
MEAGEAFRQQGAACAALGSRMYAELLRGLAEDIENQGPTARVLRGHEEDSGPSALALRLLGSVHRLVLERRAGGLAAYYPSVGGHWNPAHGVPAFIELLARDRAAVRAWLDRPPQTNEVGRASALMGGLLHLPEQLRGPVRLFELGSSGGLNLLADRFSYVDAAGTRFGAEASPVQLRPAWRGDQLVPWPGMHVVEAVGSDVAPVDAATTEGRLALTAYVWPDQTNRLDRLRGALQLARATPPVVRRQGAADFADGVALEDGATTVLWHSVMWQYLPSEEQERTAARIEELGEQATDGAPFVHLSLEPARRAPDRDHEFLVVMTTWPGGERQILGRAAPHGVPVTWETSG